MTHTKRGFALFLLAPVLMLAGGHAAPAAQPSRLIDEATATVRELRQQADGEAMAQALRAGRGVLIVPRMLRAGLVIGGLGGDGVLLARDPETGRWSDPVFVELKGASLGLQVGAETKQALFVIKTERALKALLSRQVNVGADATLVAGDSEEWRAEKARTFGSEKASEDLLAFASGEGLYAGTSINGTLVEAKEEWNRRVHGADRTPTDIVNALNSTNPTFAELKKRLARP